MTTLKNRPTKQDKILYSIRELYRLPKPEADTSLTEVKNLFWQGSVSWLKQEVKKLGFRGYSTLKKGELQDILFSNRKPPYRHLKVSELKKIARAQNINFQSRATKAQLIGLISGADNNPAPRVNIVYERVDNIIRKFYVDARTYKSGNIDYILTEAREPMLNEIRQHLRNGCKVRIGVDVRYINSKNSNALDCHWGSRRDEAEVVLPMSTNIEQLLDEWVDRMKNKIDRFSTGGSGWILTNVYGFRVEMYEYVPLRGSSYVKTPRDLAVKKAVINVNNSREQTIAGLKAIAGELGLKYTSKSTKDDLQSLIKGAAPDYPLEDNKCFLWAVLSCLYHDDVKHHHERLSKYKPYENELNTDGVKYPVVIDKVQRFAAINNLIINVFEWDNRVSVLHIDERLYKVDQKIVNLIWYEGHYMWIKSMPALMYDQTRHGRGGKYTCLRCLQHFTSERTQREHIEKCTLLHDGKCKVVMPKKGEVVEFKSMMKMEKVPYVVYADFESVISKETNVHTPCGFATNLVNSMGQSMQFNLY